MLGQNTSTAVLRKSAECNILDVEPSQEPVIAGLSFHHFVIFVGSICAGLAVLIATGHILHHAARCYRVSEQKYLMRVIWVIPAFAIVFTLASWFYETSEYISTIPEIVEAVSFVSLFQLFVLQATGTTDRNEQEAFFQNLPRLKREKWAQMISKKQNQTELRHGNGSLRWFRATSVALFQFPVVKVLWVPVHIILTWITCPTSKIGSILRVVNGIINATTTTIALFAMIFFYRRLRSLLKPRHAFKKAFVFKKMIGIVLLQSTVMSFVSALGAVHPTAQMSYGDYTVGLPALLSQCEMFLFALGFLYCYNVKEFANLSSREDQEAGLRTRKTSFGGAILAMLNISDLIGGVWYATKHLFSMGQKKYTVDGVSSMKLATLHDNDSSGSLTPQTPLTHGQNGYGAQNGYYPSPQHTAQQQQAEQRYADRYYAEPEYEGAQPSESRYAGARPAHPQDYPFPEHEAQYAVSHRTGQPTADGRDHFPRHDAYEDNPYPLPPNHENNRF